MESSMCHPLFFLSDLHLDKKETDRIEHFIEFLHFCQKQKATLSILGDLFNFWVGDAQAQWSVYQPLLRIMKQMAKESKLYFLAGNRDFLFSSYWKRQTGYVLEEKTVLALSSQRLLLSHGDILCTKDILYQKIRSILRTKVIYQLSRLLPGFVCLRMGQNLRKASKASIKKKDYSLLKPDLVFAEKLLDETHCDTLLCGHFHLPGNLPLSSAKKLYILPECTDNLFRYLVWEREEFLEKQWP